MNHALPKGPAAIRTNPHPGSTPLTSFSGASRRPSEVLRTGATPGDRVASFPAQAGRPIQAPRTESTLGDRVDTFPGGLSASGYQMMIARAEGETLLNLRLTLRADDGLNSVEKDDLEAAIDHRYGQLNLTALKHQKPRWHGQP